MITVTGKSGKFWFWYKHALCYAIFLSCDDKNIFLSCDDKMGLCSLCKSIIRQNYLTDSLLHVCCSYLYLDKDISQQESGMFVITLIWDKAEVECRYPITAIKELFLVEFNNSVEMDKVYQQLVINWDQTGINYVPVSSWIMALSAY